MSESYESVFTFPKRAVLGKVFVIEVSKHALIR